MVAAWHVSSHLATFGISFFSHSLLPLGANPDGDRVYIGGQEYRSFSTPNSNVIVSPPNGNRGSSTVYHRGGNTVVNGRCEICNVDI